jgi:two-component system sensor histidine kinase KdpD
MWATSSFSNVRNYAMAVLLAFLTTGVLWLLRDDLTQANFSLVYLFVVFLIAIRQGTGPSLVAATVSFLGFNFVLVKPYYTFIVADPRELLDLIIFFVTAILTGQLAARARQQAETARRRAHERDILYRLTSAFNQLTTTEGVYNALKQVLTDELSARHVYTLPYTNDKMPQDQTIAYVLLQTGDQIYGTLCVSFDQPPTPFQLRLLNTCAAHGAMALQRIDLTERARKSQSFEEADRLKTALLHAVSHDLRTPITIIKTSVSNLLNLHSSLPEPERVDMLATIESEADHLNKMVGNLLDMSRLQAGALQLNVELNSLEEIAGEVAARAYELTGQERIKIDFPEEMPLVPFDYGLLLQALTNLVDNALRYEPAESQVVIQGIIHEGEVRMAVVNHGPNIPIQERNHIMEPFYRGKDGHVGLGLPIAKGIVEAHHGKLWIEDTPGGGATFVLSLLLESVKQDVESVGGG